MLGRINWDVVEGLAMMREGTSPGEGQVVEPSDFSMMQAVEAGESVRKVILHLYPPEKDWLRAVGVRVTFTVPMLVRLCKAPWMERGGEVGEMASASLTVAGAS